MSKITVLIPCKNEITNIAACVETVRQLADEILIADSGSTDGTLEWAQQDTDCRVIEREFVNSGDFKNWAIPQATHGWVLIVDADERVTPELAQSILATTRSATPQLGYWIYRQNHFMGHRLRHTSWGRDRVVRLVQRDHARYRLHTDHSEVDLPNAKTGLLQGKLIHYTCWDYDNYLAKMLRYTEQQAELWYQAGKRPSLLKLVFTGPGSLSSLLCASARLP